MLHRSYTVLGTAGLNFTAVDQTPAITRKRTLDGRGFVAVNASGRIVGTVVYHPPSTASGTPWLRRRDVAHFGQFAVEPSLQGQGIGGLLLRAVETAAIADGATELALDTAEPATHLVALYAKLGYRFIELAQWDGKRYRSVIMSKTLAFQPIGVHDTK